MTIVIVDEPDMFVVVITVGPAIAATVGVGTATVAEV